MVKLDASNKSFLTLLQEILGTSRKVYYDTSIREVDTTDWGCLFSHSGISELIILGDKEDDLWTQEDILNEILQYFNLHIVQLGQDFYIFNWATIKRGGQATFKLILGSGQD